MWGAIGNWLMNNPTVTGSLLGMGAGQLIGGDTKSTLIGGGVGGLAGGAYGASTGTGMFGDLFGQETANAGAGAGGEWLDDALQNTADVTGTGGMENFGTEGMDAMNGIDLSTGFNTQAVPTGGGVGTPMYGNTAGLYSQTAQQAPSNIYDLLGQSLIGGGQIYGTIKGADAADEALDQRQKELDAYLASVNREETRQESAEDNMTNAMDNYYYA